MSDVWSEIQSIKNKQLSLREKLAQRKKQRLDVVADIKGTNISENLSETNQISTSLSASSSNTAQNQQLASNEEKKTIEIQHPVDPEILNKIEIQLLEMLIDVSINLPVEFTFLLNNVSKSIDQQIPLYAIENLIEKYAAQSLLTISTIGEDEDDVKQVVSAVDQTKLAALHEHEIQHEKQDSEKKDKTINRTNNVRKRTNDLASDKFAKSKRAIKDGDIVEETIESLLSTHSAKERENKKITENILQLLSKATAKETVLSERFKSQGGFQVKEFCMFGTREECRRQSSSNCNKLHFIKIMSKHTDESLGDCSFLNTCFHMDSCKFVHYQIDYPSQLNSKYLAKNVNRKSLGSVPKAPVDGATTILFPPQWVQCDLRKFNMSVLGKFTVIMADPPWDIHMELPYGTMSDDEMRKLSVPILQDDGYIFLWVTGRAMELGRECLQLWGYERADELIWVKTNQLQRIIRTGRTGHWLNHGKEHCLIGVKGNPKGVNRGLDCDVIVSEVRATSHKPDEIYGIIERLAPGSRKIELFGRPHNVQPNWVTLGNQVDGVKLLDPEIVRAFKAIYPDGNCL